MKEQMTFLKENKNNILLSLREEYYMEMLNGTKKFEYRTRYLKE